MNLGKDGKPWDKSRWIDWAASPTRSNLRVTPQAEQSARASGAKHIKHRGMRRPCDCGRMNLVALKVCPGCGKGLR
jgi:hypothetical protein